MSNVIATYGRIRALVRDLHPDLGCDVQARQRTASRVLAGRQTRGSGWRSWNRGPHDAEVDPKHDIADVVASEEMRDQRRVAPRSLSTSSQIGDSDVEAALKPPMSAHLLGWFRLWRRRLVWLVLWWGSWIRVPLRRSGAHADRQIAATAMIGIETVFVMRSMPLPGSG